ncbi:hypothetical protein GBO86_03620 [Pediococcus acidilactici]|nr:hypothetical protein GBO86_03620 [Pediococcus acidilactici]UWF33552.1 hypothetical protein NYR25_08190 [Pediococcus acidilactici]
MKVESNVVITEFIINMDNFFHLYDNHDVDVAEQVQDQATSLAQFDVPFYVLTNSPDPKDSGNLHIVNMKLFEHYPDLTLYFYRFLMAYEFLLAHPEIEKAALTDAKDVTMLNYPFDKVDEGVLYIGDEWKRLGDADIIVNSSSPQYMKDFSAKNATRILLNIGVLVGTRDVLLEYLGIMAKLITDEQLKIQQGNENAGLDGFEMEIGNYVAYRYFADRLVHGREVTTIFKGFQEKSSAWFKHK